MTAHKSHTHVLVALVVTFGLSGCAAISPGTSSAVEGQEVRAYGTVLELESGGGPKLCFGLVADTNPSSCNGLPITDWDWTQASDATALSGTIWGRYLIHGVWDGRTFALTRPPEVQDDEAIPGVVAAAGESALDSRAIERAAEHYAELVKADANVLSVVTLDRVYVSVIFDDGQIQRAADRDFGTGIVYVESALIPDK